MTHITEVRAIRNKSMGTFNVLNGILDAISDKEGFTFDVDEYDTLTEIVVYYKRKPVLIATVAGSRNEVLISIFADVTYHDCFNNYDTVLIRPFVFAGIKAVLMMDVS